MSAVLFCMGFLPSIGQTNCILKVEKDSVKVWVCRLNNSKYKAVKSLFILPGSLSEITAMVLDVDGHGEWNYKTVSSRILKKISDREIIYYTEIAAPILTSNRDFVIRMTVDQNPVTQDVIIDLVSIPDYIPPKQNVIRVPFSKARWTIKSLSVSILQLDYYIEIDLGGSVPAWIVNMVAPQAPVETFRRMRSTIGKYKGRSVPGICN